VIFQEDCHLKFAYLEKKKSKMLFLSLSKNNNSLFVLLVLVMVLPLIIASGNATSVAGESLSILAAGKIPVIQFLKPF
jgi:hypothetical protein